MSDLHWRRKEIYFKKESAYGTDPVHADTDAMLCKNVSITPYSGNTVPRDNDKIHFGQDQQINVNPFSQIQFDIPLAGAGTAVDTPPAYSEVLEGCGMLETITAVTDVAYTPDAGDLANEFESGAIEFYLDGQSQLMLGGHGNMELVVTPGGYAFYRFTYQARYAVPTVVALPTADKSDFQVELPVTDTNTPTVSLDGVAVVLHSLNLNLGNVLAVRDLPNITRNVIIADRKATGSIVIEAPDLTTKDWFAEIRSDDGADTSVLQLVHGTVAFNIVTIDCPVVQLSNMVIGESDGIVTYGFDLSILPSAGNDEISITTT